MKKWIILLFYFTLSCVETGENSPPDDLIPPDHMSAVMVDILIMKNIKREYAYIKEKQNLLASEYIYDKHKIDSQQLARSQSYYAKNPKKYFTIFKMVQNHLKKLNDSIQESLRATEKE